MVNSYTALKNFGRLVAVITLLILAVTFVTASIGSRANASPTGSLSQAINVGTLSTDIKDATGTPVPSPSFSLAPTVITTSCQTTSGTYGSNSQRVYADNPGDANFGWTLTIAATNGSAAKWQSGPNQYDFDEPSGGGCDNGQLSLDPSVATLTLETGSNTGITLGSAADFNNNSSITLLSADGTADNIWRGYLTGIGISQKIPASTPAGSYAIDLTQTIINL